jgi:hypothetical protein
MPLRGKYSINDWILSNDCVDIGDIIAYYDDTTLKEVHAKVLNKYTYSAHTLYVENLDTHMTLEIDFYATVCYNITKGKAEPEICTCGAKHTSNPKHHLNYCKARD